MKIFLAGGETRHWIPDLLFKKKMELYLAGQNGIHGIIEDAIIHGRGRSVERWGGVRPDNRGISPVHFRIVLLRRQ